MAAYYNENDKYCAEWLRNLIKKRLIADGDVDDRDIKDVKPRDLKNYDQCHFFAGIGGWSYALRLAGVPDVFPVWTGSCPCQPFSQAGKGKGFDDDRHLWPVWFELIKKCHPPIIFGEQVESHEGLAWLDLVSNNLESAGYAVAAANLCAAGVGAPHIRQRLWFVADRERKRCAAIQSESPARIGGNGQDRRTRPRSECSNPDGELADAARDGQWQSRLTQAGNGWPSASRGLGPWRDLEWLSCTDGKARPIKSGICPLAHGVFGRVGRLRAIGNAIVPQLAAEFIKAVMECIK